jgi:predicted nucleic acid-binding Zn ribbon protein
MPHSKGFGRRKDRRATDPVAIGSVLDELLEQDELSRGIPIATLMRRWPELVGERLGSATRPTALEGGILTVSASDGPWGAQARYLTEEIRTRADEALGGGVIRAVRVVVGPSASETRNRR